MISLGVNTVLYGAFDFKTAVARIAEAGYDGIEVAAIANQREHLELGRWRQQATEMSRIVTDHGLRWLAIEEAAHDDDRVAAAIDAAAEIGIPIVNLGAGGESDGNRADLDAAIGRLGRYAAMAEGRGVTVCVKAHVGQAIWNTETVLAAVAAISSPAFGLNLDPSHIYRAGEEPAVALRAVIDRVRHVHIRDCRGRDAGPGTAVNQICGRGDIDLRSYLRELVDAGYGGALCLEVIGAIAEGLDLTSCQTVAAESAGYLRALLGQLGRSEPGR